MLKNRNSTEKESEGARCRVFGSVAFMSACCVLLLEDHPNIVRFQESFEDWAARPAEGEGMGWGRDHLSQADWTMITIVEEKRTSVLLFSCFKLKKDNDSFV